MSEEEKEAIDYYTINEYSFGFEIDCDIESFKKAIGIEETDEDTFEKHQIRFKTLLNLIEKQQKKIDELKKYEKYYEEMEEVNKKFISVDKIREKIEEYKKPKKFKEVDEYGEIIEGEIIYKDIVEALKKLLKEE